MKKATSIIAALFLAAVFTTSFESCGKYEEGPSFTVKSKKGRLSRQWLFDAYVDGATGSTAPIAGDDVIEFMKNGTYTLSASGFSIPGTWEFSSNKEDIYATIDLGIFGSITDTMRILRLTSKEFWTISTNGSNDETHYKAK
ncbi:MAG: hypothetical protein JKX73_00040 [Flavobacteriales bacterium]|nr:hypothetical protein [Flavobacteriales bacterium]